MKQKKIRFNNIPIIYPERKEEDEMLFKQFEKLPKELQVVMAKFLDIKTVTKLCQSSSVMNTNICNNDYFWKIKTQYDFTDVVDIPEESDNWKTTYKEIKDSEIYIYKDGRIIGSGFLYDIDDQ